MRDQTKLTFQIGTFKQHSAFEKAIITEASRVCGGCTTSTKTGWWMDDGDQHKGAFEGTLVEEHCFELELTCESHKAGRAYTAVKRAICDAAEIEGVDTNWVHVTQADMIGRHFSVSEFNAARAADLMGEVI